MHIKIYSYNNRMKCLMIENYIFIKIIIINLLRIFKILIIKFIFKNLD